MKLMTQTKQDTQRVHSALNILKSKLCELSRVLKSCSHLKAAGHMPNGTGASWRHAAVLLQRTITHQLTASSLQPKQPKRTIYRLRVTCLHINALSGFNVTLVTVQNTCSHSSFFLREKPTLRHLTIDGVPRGRGIVLTFADTSTEIGKTKSKASFFYFIFQSIIHTQGDLK